MHRFSFKLLSMMSICASLLSGCVFEPIVYDVEIDGKYVNKLEKPSHIVKNREELANICDYYAFYHVDEFFVELDSSYRISNLSEEMNKIGRAHV